MSCRAGRTVLAVVWTAPETSPSTSPSASIIVPSTTVSSRPFSACSGVSPLLLRRSHHRVDIAATDAVGIDDFDFGGQFDAVRCATARMRSGSPSSTQWAMPFSAQIAAALRVRGSSPSGRTMRRLRGARRLDETVTEHRRRHQQLDRRVDAAGQRPDVDPLGDETDHPLHAFAVGAADVTGEIGEPRRRGEGVVGRRQQRQPVERRALSSAVTSGAGRTPQVKTKPASGMPRSAINAVARMASERSPGVMTSVPGRIWPSSFSGARAATSGFSMRAVSMSPRLRISSPSPRRRR